MGFLDLLFPTPTSHAKGVCRVMNLAFNIKLAEAEKHGEVDVSFGEIAKRALSTRPGWKAASERTFRYSHSGDVISIDIQADSLIDVVKRVVAVETKVHLMKKRRLSDEDVARAVDSAIEAVEDYFRD